MNALKFTLPGGNYSRYRGNRSVPGQFQCFKIGIGVQGFQRIGQVRIIQRHIITQFLTSRFIYPRSQTSSVQWDRPT